MSYLGRWARDLLDASVIALWLGLLVRTFVVQVYQVPSSSMEPLLQSGDYVLVNKLLVQDQPVTNPWLPQRGAARGDVLVFPHPQTSGSLVIKRCLAGAGDHVQIRDKVLFINRDRVEEPYVANRDERVYPASSFLPKNYRVRDQFGPIVVSPSDLFCLGDNRDHSLDSRHWGTIEERRTVGQAIFALRPPSKTSAGLTEVDEISRPKTVAIEDTSSPSSLNQQGFREPGHQSPEGWRAFRVQ